jgi:hypothetical protein
MFLKKLSLNDEQARTNFLKEWELTVQACDTSNVHRVLQIFSEAKVSV